MTGRLIQQESQITLVYRNDFSLQPDSSKELAVLDRSRVSGLPLALNAVETLRAHRDAIQAADS